MTLRLGDSNAARRTPPPRFQRPAFHALLAAAIAIAIFLIDTATTLDIAIAVLYVIVVLVAANFLPQRGVLLVASGCLSLTVLSFLISHGLQGGTPLVRCLISLAAIGIATALAIQHQHATTALRDQFKEIKRAEQALKRSEAYSAEAQRLSLTGSFGRRKGTNEILFWSEEMYRIFGYEPGTRLTTDVTVERVHPDDILQYRDGLDRMARGEPDVRVQYRLLMPDRSVKHVRVLAHATVDEVGRAEYVGAVMDVTAAKRAEEALHEAHAALAHVTRVATLGELMASIAHEVNQPLAAIVTNGEACLRWLGREEPDLDEARSAVTRMICDGRRAGEVVRRLRALSKKDAPQTVPLNLNDIVEETIPLLQRELSMHRVSLRLDLDPQLPPVLGDRIQLQQVLINLMINGMHAISATDGPRDLVVRSERVADGIVVSVQDSGIGLDKDVADRIFHPFFSTKTTGLGMGLSISRSIIESQGGRIWARNNDGRGASFLFFLPSSRQENLGSDIH
jgi:PAS domain S-box-containing protein